jgi:DNA-binding IclR family transcriptional regulator
VSPARRALAPTTVRSVALAETRSGGPPRIQSLCRADRILSAVAGAGSDGIRLAALSKAVGLNKTTTFNIVETLLALGYVKHDPARKAYSLGFRLVQLGLASHRQIDLVEIAADVLTRLCVETRETVNLAVPAPRFAVIVDSREGSHNIRMTAYTGTPAPYHAAACGKAILAFMPQPSREAVLRGTTTEAITVHTKTRSAEIERELEAVRREGLAFDLEEMEIAAHCVAAPILDETGAVCGSISVAGLRDRLPLAALRDTGRRIRQEIAVIESRIRGQTRTTVGRIGRDQ